MVRDGIATIPTATTTSFGAALLSNSTSSTSEIVGATSKAVKEAYDLAESAGSVASASAQNAYDLANGAVISIGTMSALVGGDTLVEAVDALWEEKISPYNLITGASPIRTGRQIDGKDEYVKRYHFTSINSANTFTKSLGFTLSSVIIIKSYGMAYSNSHNWFPISMGDFNNETSYAVRYNLAATNNVLQLVTANGNFNEAYIEIYYINRNE